MYYNSLIVRLLLRFGSCITLILIVRLSASLRVTTNRSADIQLSDNSDIVQFNKVALLCANGQTMYAHRHGLARSAIHMITAY